MDWTSFAWGVICTLFIGGLVSLVIGAVSGGFGD